MLSDNDVSHAFEKSSSQNAFYVNFAKTTSGTDTFSLLTPNAFLLLIQFGNFLFWYLHLLLFFLCLSFLPPRNRNAYTPVVLSCRAAFCSKWWCLSENNKSRQTWGESKEGSRSRWMKIISFRLVFFLLLSLPGFGWKVKARCCFLQTNDMCVGKKKNKNKIRNNKFSHRAPLSWLPPETNLPSTYKFHVESDVCCKVQPKTLENKPGSYFMSNKYLCLYFVWNLWSNKHQNTLFDINDFDCKYIIGLLLGWCSTQEKGWIFEAN